MFWKRKLKIEFAIGQVWENEDPLRETATIVDLKRDYVIYKTLDGRSWGGASYRDTTNGRLFAIGEYGFRSIYPHMISMEITK